MLLAPGKSFGPFLLLRYDQPVTVNVEDNPLPGDAARTAGVQGDGLGLEVGWQ